MNLNWIAEWMNGQWMKYKYDMMNEWTTKMKWNETKWNDMKWMSESWDSR